ncbi:delta(24)-sterol reductase [Agrilus planipennis]|uniref:Delta(24)-sterol reductase n=1 Tax=Agrilus planipennis TaxID=224129 RepID=A0A1W4WSS7_AGRPL|nr:delta(24)-sterol reductase [Agrilus planipennis]
MSAETTSLMKYLIINYRWVLVCFFLLPLSFLYNGYFAIRNWIFFKLSSAPKNHLKKVQSIQKQVQEWNKKGRKKKLCTARPGWQTMSFRRPAYKNTSHQIVVDLVDVLEINLDQRWVEVEPMVTMGQLTTVLNPLGWTIPVVPELDDLTVGGLVMGTGIESASHKHGLFQSICLSYEMVLGDGSVINCSENENSELFYSVPWSYGTLGILTATRIRLIPAKQFIKLKYHAVHGLDKICERFVEASSCSDNEFVEGILFGPDRAVVMTGNFTDKPEPDKINCIGKWYKPWFFKHVEKKLNPYYKNDVEYLPLRDYYHRHTRSIFWEAQDIIPFGNNLLFRVLLGWLMPPKVSFLKLTQTETTKELYENHHVIQDILIPAKHLHKSIKMFHETLEVYPLWLCPFYLGQAPGMVHSKSGKSEMYVDVGVYGVPKVLDFKPEKSTRKIEKFAIDHDGYQMLYADTYTTKEEFRNMFDHKLYDKLRKKLNCEDTFPEVYEKVSRKARI